MQYPQRANWTGRDLIPRVHALSELGFKRGVGLFGGGELRLQFLDRSVALSEEGLGPFEGRGMGRLRSMETLWGLWSLSWVSDNPRGVCCLGCTDLFLMARFYRCVPICFDLRHQTRSQPAPAGQGERSGRASPPKRGLEATFYSLP